MGATKASGEDEVRWMSNNSPIDPFHEAWKSDPRKDTGQFYAAGNNVSCLLMSIRESCDPKEGCEDHACPWECSIKGEWGNEIWMGPPLRAGSICERVFS